MLTPEISAVLDGSSRWHVAHGDCLDVLRQLPDGCVDAVVTDPPYSRTSDGAVAISRTIARMPPETQFFESWLREHLTEWKRVLSVRGAMWLTLDWRGCVSLDGASARVGFRKAPTVGIWDKKRIGMGGILRRRYEPFAVQLCDEFEVVPTGQPDVWEFPWSGPTESEHPAEKPIPLLVAACKLVAPKGSLIFDPFCGSGSTGVAAIQEGYRFLGIEREPSYVDIARRRIADAAAQGNLFAEVPA